MKRFKKMTAILTAGLMLLSVAPIGGIMAIGKGNSVGIVSNAEGTEGDFEYRTETGGAVVSKYIGSGGDVVIPDTLGGSLLHVLIGLHLIVAPT